MSPAAHPKQWCRARLAYQDPKAALEFLTAAFGLRERNRVEDPDGTFIVWLGFGQSTMMIGRSGLDRHNLFSPLETGKATAEMNVGVDDIDAHYRRAKAAGAKIERPLENATFGQRHYEASDPEGHTWHFMKPIEDYRGGKSTPERLELRLAYNDERAAQDFLTRAFGFKELARLDYPGGFMAWLGFADGIVMIGRADGAEQFSPAETGKPTAMLNVAVANVDEHYAHAVGQGARIVSDLQDVPWGFRTYEALDTEGHRWHIMQGRA